jgi:hypothetical protein
MPYAFVVWQGTERWHEVGIEMERLLEIGRGSNIMFETSMKQLLITSESPSPGCLCCKIRIEILVQTLEKSKYI